MTTETKSEPLGEIQAASTAGGGTALTSTVTRILLPLGTKHVALIPRNYAGATVVKFNFNPYLTVLKTTDSLATAPTDYSTNAQDGSTSTDITLSSLPTLASGGALYVGAHVPFSGLVVDVDAANATASTLTASYWDGTAWTTLSATDGTTSGGATFAIDGSITWSVPSAWLVGGPIGTTLGAKFWARLTVSAALDSSTTLNSMLGISRLTTYAELPAGLSFEQSLNVGENGYASVNALTDAGTANLIVNAQTRNGSRFS